jgi:Zn-finger nucleic acid-binding protein
MPAETLRCPSCGAAVSSAATRCDFCKATLATVTCPTCFGVMFAGAKFCSHCGAKGNRSEMPGAEASRCPRCQVAMNSVTVGTTSLLECSRCEGIWLDVETLNQISADREKQVLVAGAPTASGEDLQLETNIRYVPCPVCHELMNRDQFAHCSHVIVDVCKPHGTWFDKDELRRAVQFIRAGGLEKARSQELEQLKDEQRRLAFARLHSATFEPQVTSVSGEYGSGADITTSAIKLLFKLLS